MSQIAVTKEQLQIMQHSVGNKPRCQSHRNNFAISPGCDSYEDCEKLAEMGLMSKGCVIPGGMQYYHVTDAGWDFLGLNH